MIAFGTIAACAPTCYRFTHMDRRYRSRAWGILEMEAPFFELIGESPEACEIIAQPNVMLFDTRMLNTSTTVGAIGRIHPAAR